jgi:hypothetical protein
MSYSNFSSYSYLFVPRPERHNSGEAIYGSPEQGPNAALQAVVNMALIGNTGEIRLGPYEYLLKSTLEIPAGITVVGVPGLTKIRIVWTTSNPRYGPVVKLAPRSIIRNCYLDLTLGAGEFAQDTGTFTDPDDVVSVRDSLENSVVQVNGEWARVENCEIPSGPRRGILVTTSRAMITGNTISHDTANNNAAIYVDDTYYGCIIANNACYTYPGIISVKDVVEAGDSNVVAANFATLVER